MAFGPEIQIEPTEERPVEVRLGAIARADLADLPGELGPDVTRYLKPAFAQQLTDLADGGEYFDELSDDPHNIHWGIFCQEGLVGITGFRDVNIGGPKHPVGRIAIMRAVFLGRGYGGAAIAARTTAFDRGLGFDHNVVEVDVQNVPAVRIHKAAGYAVSTQVVHGERLRHAMVQSRTGKAPYTDPHQEAERTMQRTLAQYKIRMK